MRAVIFTVLFIAGLATMSSAHHCNSVCATVRCISITNEECAKQGGVFKPRNPDPEAHPCVCCDSCTTTKNAGGS